MRFSIALLAVIIALLCSCSVTGCSTTPQTREAIVFKSFRDTWNVALRAHDVYCERAVLGKVKPADMAKVDAAWNKFRLVFSTAFRAANRDWTVATPEALTIAERELLNIIRTL